MVTMVLVLHETQVSSWRKVNSFSFWMPTIFYSKRRSLARSHTPRSLDRVVSLYASVERTRVTAILIGSTQEHMHRNVIR